MGVISFGPELSASLNLQADVSACCGMLRIRESGLRLNLILIHFLSLCTSWLLNELHTALTTDIKKSLQSQDVKQIKALSYAQA